MPIKNTNPFLVPSKHPFSATPFDEIRKEHFLPALDETMKMARERLGKIQESKGPATFDNTVLILETAAEEVQATATVFFGLLGAESDDELQAMARDISPKMADFSSDILLDAKIFARLKEVYENRQKLSLSPEQLRLVEKVYRDFVRNGALLNEPQKNQLRELDQKSAQLGPVFSDNVLKATNQFEMLLSDKKDLAGLPESIVEAAAFAAKKAGKTGWLFNLQGPSISPFLQYADSRALREKIWRAYSSRAFKDTFDNTENCRQLAQLRHERANLLGYPTHAAFVLEERMAESPERVQKFLERLLDKSRAAGERDIAQVRALMQEQTGESELMPWDYSYWSEKLKLRDYSFDEEELRPYFKLESVVSGVFEHARRLFGITFKQLSSVPVYHADVKVYEVIDEKTSRHIGLFYTDFFPRPSKRSGAWMGAFREQGLFRGKIERPHVSIVCNFSPPTEDKPSLLTMDEVRTLFHEFGHALHGLLSECTYVSMGGTNVYWDFVELPSQIMENWALEKEALDLFAAHFETGEKIPVKLTEKIKATAKFQAGYFSLRQLSFGLLDMAWHTADPKNITDIVTFERAVTERTSLLKRVDGTNVSCAFSHIFAGGYSSGYYSYKWAEVLDADAFEFFKEKGLFNKEVAASFRENILSKGGTEHPMELYKNFRGREPDPDALLRRDGLI